MNYETSCQCYLPQPSASADNSDLGVDNSRYHAQYHPVVAYYSVSHGVTCCVGKSASKINSQFFFRWI